MKTLGQKLKEIRVSKDLTQIELAAALHLTRNQISTYENDQVPPSIEVIISYCNYFKVSSDYLLNINNQEQDLEAQTIAQILSSSKRLNEEQRKRYLSQVKLFAAFLERYKESL